MAESRSWDPKAFGSWLESLDVQERFQGFKNPIVEESISRLAELSNLLPRHVPFEIVHVDYLQTNDQIKMLTDIRFKLLAFVPPIVGASVTLLSAKAAIAAGDRILIGAVGI